MWTEGPMTSVGEVEIVFNANLKIGQIIKMDYIPFVRIPFVVQAIEITTENIEDVAKYVGDIKSKEDGTPYILVDRRLVPNVYRVYPGFFMTKMGENVRCYSRKVFREQFVEMDEEIRPWVALMNGEDSKAGRVEVTDGPPEQIPVVGEYGRIIEPAE